MSTQKPDLFLDGQLCLILSDAYRELKLLANKLLNNNSGRNVCSPTSLVHESYLKVMNRSELKTWSDRRHFFASMAYVMRSILVDRARHRQRDRAALATAVTLMEAEEAEDALLLELDLALTELGHVDPEVNQVVHLKFFSGLTFSEIGEYLDISERTAQRYWEYGKTFLIHAMEKANQP